MYLLERAIHLQELITKPEALWEQDFDKRNAFPHGSRQYLHVSFNEGFCHSEHVSVLDQFKQVFPQFLLVLSDFSQLNLQLLQLLLKQSSSYLKRWASSKCSSNHLFIGHQNQRRSSKATIYESLIGI